MKLTPRKVKELASIIEQNLENMGCDNAPIDQTIAYWISDWCRDQMMGEAHNFYAKATDQ